MRYLFFSLFLFPLFGNEYDEILKVCDQYKRPFSILNLNAGDGELAFYLAEKYPNATVVLAEQDIGIDNKLASALVEKIKDNNSLKNVVIISAQINVNDAERIANCEHCDIVICSKSPYDMNLPINTSAQDIIDLMRRLGQHVFINHSEVRNEEKTTIKKNLLFRDKNVTNTYHQSKQYLHYYKECKLTNTSLAVTKSPGISLITFQTYRGIWPEVEYIQEKLLRTKTMQFYGAATPWNVIISGERINFEFPAENAPPVEDSLTPILWQIWEDFFNCMSKREMQELIENNYFD